MQHIVTDSQMDALTGSIHAQGAELAALRKDAERYRFLRDNPWPSPVQSVVVRHANAAWDATIDAAIAKAIGAA